MTRPGLTPILGIVLVALSLSAHVAQGQEPPDDPPDTRLPGDQYDPAALPGDQYDPVTLPGDQYDVPPLPGGPLDAAPLPDGRSVPTAAPAQQLLLHLPLDGSLAHSGRTGAPRFVTRDGTPPPTYVPGHAGQALSFSGPAAIAAPFALDHAEFPRVTVTAWVREEAGASGSRDIVSSTSTAGARVGIHGGRLAARLGGRGISYGHARFPVGEWVFVAAVLDTAAGSAQLYQNDGEPFVVEGIDVSTNPPPLVSDPDDPASEPQAWIVIGASNFETFGTSSRPLVIDDVRIYGGALAGDQIAGLRDADTGPAAGPTTVVDLDSGDGGFSMSSPNAPAGATSGGALANSDALPTACQSHDDCPTGQYCAFERVCHPDRHAPIVPLNTMTAPTATLSPLPPNDQSEHDQPSAPAQGLRPTGQRVIGRVVGRYGEEEHLFELSDGFLRSIALGKFDSCAVRLNDEIFFTCRRDAESFALGVSLPTAFISSIRVCGVNQLNGIEVRGDTRRADGSYWNQINLDEDPNYFCTSGGHEFSSLNLCAPNQLATGLVVHTDELENPVGLQLICRQVGSAEAS